MQAFAGYNGVLLAHPPAVECSGSSIALRMAPGPSAEPSPGVPSTSGVLPHPQNNAGGTTTAGDGLTPHGNMQNGPQPPPQPSASDVQDEQLLRSAAEIRREWAILSKACSKPWEEPVRGPAFWDHLLGEAMWMARDFGQVCDVTRAEPVVVALA
jgi:hypothetical protein